MDFQKLLSKLTGQKTGFIKVSASYDSKSSSIAEPLAYDLNGDGTFVVISVTQKGELIVLKNDGSELWKFKTSEEIGDVQAMFLDMETSNSINASPLIADINEDGKPEFVFGTELGYVYCLDSDGNKKWSFEADGAIRGKISFLDIHNNDKHLLVFGTTNKKIYLLNSKGKKIKEIKTDYTIESTPIMFNGNIIFGTSEGYLISLDSEGEIKWKVFTESKVTAEPIIIEVEKKLMGIVFGSTDNTLYCVGSKGKIIWKFKTEGSIYSKVIVEDLNDDGLPEIIFGSCDNRLYVLNNKGIQLWSFETDFWLIGSPLVMDIDNDNKKEIIIGSYDTQIYILSAEGIYGFGFVPGISGIVTQDGNYSEIPTQDPGEIVGKKLWTYKTPGIVIGCCNSNNNLVVQTKEGKLLWITHNND